MSKKELKDIPFQSSIPVLLHQNHIPFIIFPLIKKIEMISLQICTIINKPPNPFKLGALLPILSLKENQKNKIYIYQDESWIASSLLLEESDCGEEVHKNLKGWVLLPL